MPLVEANPVNTLDFIYIEHGIYAFTRRTLNCISAKRRENHTPGPLVSWPPPTGDPILVASLELQGRFCSWSLQAECYRESIFIHYTEGVTPSRERDVAVTLLGVGIDVGVFVFWKRELPPSIMITRKPNWSFRDSKVRDWLRKGKET
jgi:hypothetical protein